VSFPARPIIAALLLTAAAISPAAAQRTAACKPVPVASTRTLPPFPPASLGLGEQGITELEVTVARNGRAAGIKIAKGSGFARLDRAASSHVRQNYLWLPMTCASAKTKVRVRWDPAGFCALTNSCRPSLN
jgi:TonB family protein